MKKKLLSLCMAAMLTLSFFGSGGVAYATPTTTIWLAVPDNSSSLTIGTTYYVVVTPLTTSVFPTQPAYGALQMTTNDVQTIYSAIPGSGFGGNVIASAPGFDTCTEGALVNHGSANDWKYYCSGGGVTNLQVYIYSTLQEANVEETDFDLVCNEPYLVAGDALSSSDFSLSVTYEGETYSLDPSQFSMSGNVSTAGTVTVSAAFNGVAPSCQVDVRSRVTYAPEGGTLGGAATEIIPGGQPSAAAPSVAYGSYVLAGWYDASSGGALVATGGGSFTPTTSTTLYAQWQHPVPVSAPDYSAEALTGLIPSAVYSINGALYTADAAGSIPILESWYGNNLSVFQTAVGAIQDGNPQTVSVLARSVAPAAKGLPSTGDNGIYAVFMLLFVLALAGASLISLQRSSLRARRSSHRS